MISFIGEHMLAFILIVVGFISFFWLMQFEKELGAKWYVIFVLAALVPVLGILSAIVLGVIENFLCNVGHFDMTIFGTVLFMPLLCLLGAKLFKKDPKMVCDIFTICIVSGAFMARVNCFFAGCCLGQFIGNTGIRWPTREAELVFYAVIAIICVIRLSKKKFDGTLYPFFMMTYGVFRFLTELLRESEHFLFGVIDIFLVWAVLCFAIGAIYYFKNKNAAKNRNKKKLKSA